MGSDIIPNGTYTVIDPDNPDAYVTLRLKGHWLPDKPNRVAEFLSGPDNEGNYTGFAFVLGRTVLPWRKFAGATDQLKALKVLLSNGTWREAGEAYAIRSGNCFRCSKRLTVPVSLSRGLGPECAKKIEELVTVAARRDFGVIADMLPTAMLAAWPQNDDHIIFDEPVTPQSLIPSMSDVLGPSGVIARTLSGYEVRPQQIEAAQTIAEGIVAKEHVIVEAGTGCIYGDAEIVVNRAGIGRRFRLKDLVAKFNGLGVRSESPNVNNRREYRWDLSIPTYVQREVNGVIRLALLVNAWCSGMKQTYTVTTESGRTIRATDEHPFLTERGWLRLDELQIGDAVHVAGQQATDDRKAKPRYTDIYQMHAHPFAHRRKNGSAAVARHRLVVEAALNGLGYESFVARVRSGKVSELQFLDPARVAVHHSNHNCSDDTHSNLAVVDHIEHARLHAEAGTVNNVLYKVKTEHIVSVAPFGTEITYDLEVADDPHNFIVNGFVVHNTGKSLAYLIPAIYSRRKTIVSTGDKNLQDQLWRKDVPFLKSVLPVSFSAAILKGKNNYLCADRYTDALGAIDLQGGYEFEQVRRWVENTESGDIEELPFSLSADLQSRITSTSDTCTGKHCAFFVDCYAEKAKTRADQSDVVIVNHTLLCLDAAIRAKSDGYAAALPDRELVIVDEAHRLEDAATLAFTTELSATGILRLLHDKHVNAAKVDADTIDHIEGWIDAFFGDLAKLSQSQTHAIPEPPQALLVKAEKLANALYALAKELERLNPYTGGESRDQEAFKKFVQRVKDLAGTIETILLPSTGHVVYVEKRQGQRRQLVYLKRCPISVADDLRESLFENWPVVCTSATLATGDSFSYFKSRVGCDEARELVVGSPFDYRHNALIYLPPNGKEFDPTRYYQEGSPEYFDRLAAQMEQLLLASDGRAFCLFTSYNALNEVYKRTAHRLKWLVLRQGDAPRAELLKQFKADGRAVLFGVKSWWEGIDVQGEALSMVILDKMPFGAPDDPIYQARRDALVRETGDKWAWFSKLALPTAIITMKQGFGRLIRTKADRGVVALLDGRISTRNYGTTVIRSLPPASQTRSMEVVKAFFSMQEK